MAVAIFRPRRRSKPPLGVQLDWSNPLTKGLIGAFLLNEGGGSTVTDLVAHVSGALSGAALPSWAPNGGECGLTFGGGTTLNSYVDAGTGASTQDLFMDVSHPATILVRVKTGASVISQGFAQRNDSNGSAGWLVGLSTTGQPIIEVTQSSVNYKLIATNAISANTLYDLVFAHNGDQNVAGQVYVNGAAVAQSNGLGGGSRTTSAANPLQFGTTNSGYAEVGANSTVATIYEVLIWNRVLSAAEIASLYASPHQIFRSTQFAGVPLAVALTDDDAGWMPRAYAPDLIVSVW